MSEWRRPPAARQRGFWSLVFEAEMHRQRRVLAWKGIERTRRHDRAQRREIERRVATGLFHNGVSNPTVTLDRELHDDHAERALVLLPRAANPIDHRGDVVGTAEVRDIES